MQALLSKDTNLVLLKRKINNIYPMSLF